MFFKTLIAIYIKRAINLKKRERFYTIGDLHGNYGALKSVLKKWHFDNEKDTLMPLGDIADGHPHPHKCLERLLQIKNLKPIIGNHDLFLLKWAKDGIVDKRWLDIGAEQTVDLMKDMKEEILYYFSLAKYHIVHENIFLCHGGFNHKRVICKQRNLNFAINRSMFRTSFQYANQNIKFKPIYDKDNSVKIETIIIGHSPTSNYLPAFNSNLINIDTGAGNGGKLTMMDLRTKKYVQS